MIFLPRTALLAGALALITMLAACTTTPEPTEFPQVGIDATPIRLHVGAIEIERAYQPPNAAPNVDHRFPVRPLDAAVQWAETRLVAAGHRVSAIKRSPPERPLPGVGYHCADLALGAPDLGGARFDQVLVILAPGSRDDDTYRALYDQGVARLVRALRGRVGHWFFVSSTSVYGQDAGEWVDEDSPAQPAAPTQTSPRPSPFVSNLRAMSGLVRS